MNFSETKTALRDLINRKDFTDAQASQFVKQTQERLERKLRPSFMQRFVSFSLDNELGVFYVPSDYIELIDIFVDEGEVERADMSKYLREPANFGVPSVFVQTGGAFRLRPFPELTKTIYLRYYGTEATLDVDTSTNHWTDACSEALIYGAAELAADHFEDERLDRFANKFLMCTQELDEQIQAEDFSGPMRIQPAYSFQDE